MMIWNPFTRKPRGFLGIDIGTSSVKVVELAGVKKGGIALGTYGELKAYGYLKRLSDPIQGSSLQMLDSEVAEMIKRILDECNAKSSAASMSIPVFSSFFTLLELPSMSDKELANAIPFQARQLVPIPISEVVLDWEIIGRFNPRADSPNAQERLLVLLVAVPREVVDKYVRVAKLAGVELRGLEVETFSMVRALLRDNEDTNLLLDIGARSTNITIVDGGAIRMSHNLDISGNEFTRALAHSLGVNMKRAEEHKITSGILQKGGELESSRALIPLIDAIMQDAEKIMNIYYRKYGHKVVRIMLGGGSTNLPGLVEYLSSRFGKEVVVGDPFHGIVFPNILEPIIRDIGPAFSVSVGLALRELVPQKTFAK
ncbi:MAG: hypothetical protein A3A80_03985 [Candidatus Terrybacteria bacterium RIFCSPLOWO2_01_FULL_44_24]|nr:MAG: hypothetical protein A3A80_03985 [Candidatus Terrybacteria bacterium RIFCSPLOWO2_01_FULL_44_24]